MFKVNNKGTGTTLNFDQVNVGWVNFSFYIFFVMRFTKSKLMAGSIPVLTEKKFLFPLLGIHLLYIISYLLSTLGRIW